MQPSEPLAKGIRDRASGPVGRSDDQRRKRLSDAVYKLQKLSQRPDALFSREEGRNGKNEMSTAHDYR